MHALHRPHLPAAVAATVGAAVLAIVLTLVTAGAVSDLGSAPASAPAPRPPVAIQASAARPSPSTRPFARSPFTGLVTLPVTPPRARRNR
jgi:hypothetical protein